MDRNIVGRASVCVLAALVGVSGAALESTSAGAAAPAPVFSPAAAPAPDGTVLSGVSCPSATSCFAVGVTGSEPQTHFIAPLVEQWNGTKWSIVPSPSRDQYSYLNGVACVRPADCFAVGSSSGDSGVHASLIEHWNGSVWSIVSSPSPGADGTVLNAVACSSATQCVAVGEIENTFTSFQPIVETWDGSSWSIATIPAVPHEGQLVGVTCAGASECFVVGHVQKHDGSSTLALRWNGATWSHTRTLDAPSSDSLRAVACSSADYCTAVGSVGGANPVASDQALIEHWNGRTWSMDAAPGPGPQSGDLYGVACPGARRCVAVGVSVGGDFVEHVVIDASNGRDWSAIAGPSAAGEMLRDIVCTTVDRCTSVGQLQLRPQDSGALVAVGRPPA